jgi:hypothetical protein
MSSIAASSCEAGRMWDVLAIAPTDDPKVIRRAYAARLRQIDPDRERETFARLRQALEWALACAKEPPRTAPPPEPAHDSDPADHPRPPVMVEIAPARQAHYDVRTFPAEPAALHQPATPPATQGAQARADERALLIALESALQRGDARGAAQLYVRAAASGALPLGDAERALARLFAVALEDRTFDGAAFRDLAKTFGWDRPELDSPMTSEVRRRVTARLAAEAWYDKLVEVADSRRWGFRRTRSRVPRLVLGRMRGWGLMRIHRPALRITLDTLKPHEIWLRDRIPPEWVATLERRLRRRELIASGAWAIFLGFLLLDAAVVVVGGALGLTKDDSTSAGLILVAFMAVLVWLLQGVVKEFIGVWRSPP